MSSAKDRNGARRKAAWLAAALTSVLGGQSLLAQELPGVGAVTPPAIVTAAPEVPPAVSTTAVTSPPAMTPAATPAVMDANTARAAVRQARANLAAGNFDAAEAGATAAKQAGASFRPTEDTPDRVLMDVAKAKLDPSALLKASRSALARKDFDAAERYAKSAEKNSTAFSFGMFGDSPSSALKDIAAARKAATGLPAATAAAKTPPAAAGDNRDARALLKQARTSLGAGRVEEAKALSALARSKKGGLGWFEDNPDRLDADIRAAEAKARTTAPAATVSTAGTEGAPAGRSMNVPRSKDEARAQLAMGRRQLAEGKIDEAAATAQRIKSATTVTWGLFEDSPDGLAVAVEKARGTRDRAEAARLLAEGRKLYERGDLEGASRNAFKSQKLNSSYSMWDLGDRPAKLLSDIATAQAKSRRTALPPVTVARNDGKGGPAKTPGGDPRPVPTPAADPAQAEKLAALQLVAEARRLGSEGKYVEARAKLAESQKYRVTYAVDEVSPELVYGEINVGVRRKVDGLVAAAVEGVTYGTGNPVARFTTAEAQLTEARELAAGFGHDVRGLDLKLGEIRSTRAKLGGTPLVGTTDPGIALVKHDTVTPGGLPNTAPGNEMLVKAREELNKGDTGSARRLAEEAIRAAGTGNPAVVNDAMAVLRSVDTEEFNQKKLGANRAFDAAESAFRRGEYPRAGAMIAAIDIRMLDQTRMGRLREINATPEMVAGRSTTAKPGTDIVRTGGTAPPVPSDGLGTPPLPLPGTGTTTGTNPGTATAANTGTKPTLPATNDGTGRARATDGGEGGLIDEHRQRQKIVFEMLRRKGIDVQTDAGEKFRNGQYDAALELLTEYVAELSGERLESAQAALLKRPVEGRISQYKLIKAQKELASGVTNARNAANERVMASRKAEDLKLKNVEKLMKEFNALYREGKYELAEGCAARAMELDPDNGVVAAAVHMAKRQRAVVEYKGIKEGREAMTLGALNDAENEGDASVIKKGIVFNEEIWKNASKRVGNGTTKIGRESDKAKQIQRKLMEQVTLSFDNQPLRQVLGELRDIHGINIVEDTQALQELGISMDSPISLKVSQISLKSALNLVLHQAKLTWVIKDEVLQVTSEDRAKDKLSPTTYAVADLVIPVENFDKPIALPGSSTAGSVVAPSMAGSTPTPVTGPNSLTGGTPVGTQAGANGPAGATNLSSGTWNKRGTTGTTEEQLIKLITATIDPKSWSDMGGPGTVEYHPLTFSLVINQTPDVQEQIQDLLAALRRLQDQEVAVEVKFITVSEDFFERVGVNFSMNIMTDKNTRRIEPGLLANTNVSDATRFINNLNPGRLFAGITPAGTFTPSLDIPITNSSFFQTVPGFGGYTGGGLGLGLAFLSDIQMFLFMEAVQGDVRANVMQAPKLTLFNGQSANITVGDSQNYVTGVFLQNLGGQFAIVPVIQPLANNQTSMFVQAVISADRRFVRLTVQPQIINIAPGPVQSFPVVVPIFTSFDGVTSSQTVTYTQFIQQPATSFVTVQTTVAVPDGGTVLMGGLKRLAESRSEYGPPILSKLPWVNRLFKNVGYGRETDSLLMMVTPRIIIQAEEEERQTGVTSTSAVAN